MRAATTAGGQGGPSGVQTRRPGALTPTEESDEPAMSSREAAQDRTSSLRTAGAASAVQRPGSAAGREPPADIEAEAIDPDDPVAPLRR